MAKNERFKVGDKCIWRIWNGTNWNACGEQAWTVERGGKPMRIQTPYCETHSREWSAMPDPEHQGR